MKYNRFLPSTSSVNDGFVPDPGVHSAGLPHILSGGFACPGRDCA